MTDIDVSKIKPGDVVGVRVHSINEGDLHKKSNVFVYTGEDNGYWVEASAIVSHTPAPKPPLKVGDRVRDHRSREREIIWIGDDVAVFRPLSRSGVTSVYALSEVETWERLS